MKRGLVDAFVLACQSASSAGTKSLVEKTEVSYIKIQRGVMSAQFNRVDDLQPEFDKVSLCWKFTNSKKSKRQNLLSINLTLKSFLYQAVMTASNVFALLNTNRRVFFNRVFYSCPWSHAKYNGKL